MLGIIYQHQNPSELIYSVFFFFIYYHSMLFVPSNQTGDGETENWNAKGICFVRLYGGEVIIRMLRVLCPGEHTFTYYSLITYKKFFVHYNITY
jgi:hypothetical protein